MVDAATRAHHYCSGTGRRARRLAAGLIAFLALSATAAACGSDDGGDSSSTAASSAPTASDATTSPGGASTTAASDDSSAASTTVAADDGEAAVDGGTLVNLLPFPIRGFDPAISTVNAQFGPVNFALFDALVIIRSEDGSTELRLLEAADSSDGINWKLKVRPGVMFSDGTPFDAEAIKFNWERLADPATAAAGATTAQLIESITVVDDLTLDVVLKAPNGQFPYTIATNSLTWVGSPTAIQADPANFINKPVGAGAFLLKEWVPNSQTTLVKNPDYYGTVHVDEVVLKEIPDEAQRLSTLQSGGGDMMRTLNGLSVQTATDAGFDSLKVAPNGGYVLFFNLSRAPFDDVRARKAISLAMNGEALSDALYGGTREAVHNIFQESSAFHDASLDLPEASDAEAQKLFDELAAENGGPLQVAMSYVPIFTAEAEWFQTKLAGFDNVEVTLDPVDSTEFQSRYSSGDFDFGMHSYQIGDPDSISIFAGTGGPVNYTQLSDPELDQLLSDGRAAMDQEERKAIYAQVQQKIIDEVPFSFFLRQESWEFYNPDVVHGATPEHQQTINGGLMFNEVWVTR